MNKNINAKCNFVLQEKMVFSTYFHQIFFISLASHIIKRSKLCTVCVSVGVLFSLFLIAHISVKWQLKRFVYHKTIIKKKNSKVSCINPIIVHWIVHFLVHTHTHMHPNTYFLNINYIQRSCRFLLTLFIRRLLKTRQQQRQQ